MENVKAGDLVSILELPGRLTAELERRNDALNNPQNGERQTASQIEKLEQAQTEAAQVASLLIDVAFNPEHTLFRAWFGECPIKSTLRMSRNGLLLRLIYVECLSWEEVREAMAFFGHRTTMQEIRKWHRNALKDLALLEQQFRLPPEWNAAAGEAEPEEGAEGGGAE